MSQTRNWFALAVKPRHEKAVAAHLGSRELDGYLPLYRARRNWSDRIKSVEMPLFPGYVFCRFDRSQRFSVVTTPGIISVVGFGSNEIPVSDAEIEAVRRALASGLPMEPWPYLREGDFVTIEYGALAGTRGRLVRVKGAARLVLNVELLQRSVTVELDRDIVRPCSHPVISIPSTCKI